MAGRDGTERFDRLVTTALPRLVREAVAQGKPVYRAVLGRVERPLLRHVLALAGSQLKAARLLGINRNTLRTRLRLFGLLPSDGPRRGRGGSRGE